MKFVNVIVMSIVTLGVAVPLLAQDRPERDDDRRPHRDHPRRDRDAKDSDRKKDGEKSDRAKRPSIEELKRKFEELDKNDDRHLSKEEFKHERAFEELDGDDDDKISLREVIKNPRLFLEALGAKNGEGERLRRFMEKDKNKDGKLSKDEFTGPKESFDRIDTNDDGFITPEELKASFKKIEEEKQKRIRERLEKQVKEAFGRQDKNKDGSISRDEFPGSKELFDEIDADDDGKISLEEMLKYKSKHHDGARSHDRKPSDRPRPHHRDRDGKERDKASDRPDDARPHDRRRRRDSQD